MCLIEKREGEGLKGVGTYVCSHNFRPMLFGIRYKPIMPWVNKEGTMQMNGDNMNNKSMAPLDTRKAKNLNDIWLF